MKKKKCTPARHRALAAHRKAQNKHVKKDPAKQRARVRESYKRHRAEILAKKKAHARGQKKAGGKGPKGKGGRPREC